MLAAGGVVVPINTRFKGDEAAFVLNASKARVPLHHRWIPRYGLSRRCSRASTCRISSALSCSETASWDDFLTAGAASTSAWAEVDTRIAALTADDMSDLIFTSGTTGRPKGVVTTHGQTLRVFEQWASIVGLTEGDRYLIVNPFFHTFGFKAGFLACLIKGATIVPHPVFDVPTVLARIAEERISMLPGPPDAAPVDPRPPRTRTSFDLSSLRLCVTGAAPVPVEMIVRMRNELTYKTIVTAYGLTESTGVVVDLPAEGDDPETIATTSGCAIPDTEVRIVDESNHELPAASPARSSCAVTT